MHLWKVIVVLAFPVVACLEENPNYCQVHEDCADNAGRTYCDLEGKIENVRNRCLPPPMVKISVRRVGMGEGTVRSEPTGIDCGSVCEGAFVALSPLTLTAVSSTTSAFSNWTSEACGREPTRSTCVIRPETDIEVIASFARKPVDPPGPPGPSDPTDDDETAPTLIDLMPPPAANDVPVDAALSLTIAEDASAVDLESVNVAVAGEHAVLAGVLQPYAGLGSSIRRNPQASNNVEVHIVPLQPFVHGAVITVNVEASSKGGALAGSYFFVVETSPNGTAPSLVNLSPAAGATQVATDAAITFTLEAEQTQVQLSSVFVSVDGVDAVVNGFIQPPFLGSGASIQQSGNSVSVVLQPIVEFDWSKIIQVRVQAQSAGGPLDAMHSFTTWAPTQALSLNGVDEYLEGLDSAEFDAADQGTWLFDVKVPYSPSRFRTLMSKSNFTTDSQWMFQLVASPDPFVRFYVPSILASEADRASATVASPLDQWFRFLAVYDGTQMEPADRLRIWLHPYDVSQNTVDGSPPPFMVTGSSIPTQVGRLVGASPDYFSGSIQTMGYWVGKAATPAEAVALLSNSVAKNPASVNARLGRPTHLWLMGNDAADRPDSVIHDRGAGPGLYDLVPQNMDATNLVAGAAPPRVQVIDASNVFDRHVWLMSFDAMDAVPGAGWPSMQANVVLRNVGAPVQNNVATSGLNPVGLGPARVNKAIRCANANGAEGFCSRNADASHSSYAAFLPSISSGLTIRWCGYWTADAPVIRHLGSFVFSNTKWIQITHHSNSAILHVQLRDDADGGVGVRTFSRTLTIARWHLLDIVILPTGAPGGKTRVIFRDNGVEQIVDDVEFKQPDEDDMIFGVGTNHVANAGATDEPFVFFGWKLGEISLADHQADTQALGL